MEKRLAGPVNHHLGQKPRGLAIPRIRLSKLKELTTGERGIEKVLPKEPRIDKVLPTCPYCGSEPPVDSDEN